MRVTFFDRSDWFRAWILLVTIGMLAACYCAIATINTSGLYHEPFEATAFINEHNPFHLMSPKWVTGKNQDDIVCRWAMVEMKARMIVLVTLWFLSVSFFLWRYIRKTRRGRAA
jgi:ABC-type branched-subunit amino acid transport system permease subunit